MLILGFLSILLGMIAELLIRTYYETQGKSTYAIRAVTKSEPKEKLTRGSLYSTMNSHRLRRGKSLPGYCAELCQRGHKVKILTSLYKGLTAHEENDNLQVFRLPVCRQKLFQVGLITMGLYVVQAIINGIRIIRDWKPQLIHVHFAVPAGAAALALYRLTGIPYLLTTHLGDIPGGSPQKTKGWFRWLYPFTKPIWRNAAAITTVSEFTQSLAEKQYGVKPVVIPNGIRINRGREIKLNSPPMIIFAGRFAPQKNLDVLIDVLEQIRDLQWNCIMLGDGLTFCTYSHEGGKGMSSRTNLDAKLGFAR